MKRFGRIMLLALLLTTGLENAAPVHGALQYYPKIDIPLNQSISNRDSDIPQLRGMDKAVTDYMAKWELKGLCLAIVRGDSLVFAKGYGWADKEAGIRMQPYHLMRFASVSKLVTAAGIMTLRDRGMLSLDQKVFGEEGILYGGVFSRADKDTSYSKITIEHLLRHEGGFRSDPIFLKTAVHDGLALSGEPTQDDYIRYGLRKGLLFQPGTSRRYSNLGYVLLSRVIEAITEQDYESFIKQNIFEPIGCNDMFLAGNTLADRLDGEVLYYSHDPEKDSYGTNDVRASAGAGGWCGSILELAKFVAAIDGKPGVPDVLSIHSVSDMTGNADPQVFSLGWNDTNPESGWSRTGTLTGTSALIHYFPDGECWMLVTNTSTWKGPRLAKESLRLFKDCRAAYSDKLPRRDLFYYE